ncbi:hypothetical protein OZ410_13375 [Robiginitalea sp. M366]|uniref:hypothetical protein n=1 Tax=Robiginitalea aestuariiviva TaxID=3036903 RepID=UPI00240CEA8C|nr:hypothetical protein [Robiginitalea aestuariiviva]MDG1573314.1 hypothetical protein [Robiginitalea aestuariiviva]
MQEPDLKRVVFYSKEDIMGPTHLKRGESILKSKVENAQLDINDFLERYQIKKYLDNGLYLNSWTPSEILDYKSEADEYLIKIGEYFSGINSGNIQALYRQIPHEYISSFWEIINNHKVYKRISNDKIDAILRDSPFLINTLLENKGIVDYYDTTIRAFLLKYDKSAEILLAKYEIKHDREIGQKLLPKSLTLEDKEHIILGYLDSDDANLNYVGLIPNVKHQSNFQLSPKTRLKAELLNRKLTEKLFQNQSGLRFGVSVSFSEEATKIIEGFVDDNHIANYRYSVTFIRENRETYRLFKNFNYLFDFIDEQGRITLVSKRSRLGVLERVMGVRSKNEYVKGTSFLLSEMTSQAQLAGYDKVLDEIDVPLLRVLRDIFTLEFQTKYNFPNNARFSVPSANNSSFEKIKLLAPEFEASLKQFKLFVEDGEIDFDLLRISSLPVALKDIPSLNESKYIYLNEENHKVNQYTSLLFSDQTLLAYVDPHKEKHYRNLCDLLVNEEVNYENYEDYNKPRIDFLINEGLLALDEDENILIKDFHRLMILKDLYENEFGSFHHYPKLFQIEVNKMIEENLIFKENTLFSRTEQSYFNYYLNKSEFTNSLDLRNSYLHGTHGRAENDEVHQNVYFMYLKLVVLAFLKIDDDLFIYNRFTEESA